ncbi:hypothetical protein D3C79_740430 [compost metagenome]
MSCGTSQCTGLPNSTAQTPGMPISITSPTQNLWNGSPVSLKRLLAWRTISATATIASTTAAANGQKPSAIDAPGMFRPRLLMKKVSSILILPRGPGRVRNTAKYQNRICNSGGMLRKVSTYTVASLLIIQFGDNLATPMMKPRSVARMTPMNVTSRVFSRPMTNTRA